MNTGSSIATQRYTAYGSRWAVKSSGTLPTDRGFTGQIRDGSRSNFDFYFYRSRYYNASIGRFVQPDTVVSDAKNPQALNRYAYGLNNPLRLIDPSGHDSMDPNWAARFAAAHGGQLPSAQDWQDYEFSLSHSGSGPNGSWTNADWQDYHDTGYLQNLWYTQTTSFALLEPADQDRYGLVLQNPVTLGSEPINDPAKVVAGNLVGLPGVDVGTITVSVHERITGRGTHVDIWLGASSTDRGTLMNPKYSLSFGYVPRRIQQTSGTLSPYIGSTIGAPNGILYNTSFDLPAGSRALGLTVTPHPWAPGAFLLIGGGPLEFDL